MGNCFSNGYDNLKEHMHDLTQAVNLHTTRLDMHDVEIKGLNTALEEQRSATKVLLKQTEYLVDSEKKRKKDNDEKLTKLKEDLNKMIGRKTDAVDARLTGLEEKIDNLYAAIILIGNRDSGEVDDHNISGRELVARNSRMR